MLPRTLIFCKKSEQLQKFFSTFKRHNEPKKRLENKRQVIVVYDWVEAESRCWTRGEYIENSKCWRREKQQHSLECELSSHNNNTDKKSIRIEQRVFLWLKNQNQHIAWCKRAVYSTQRVLVSSIIQRLPSDKIKFHQNIISANHRKNHKTSKSERLLIPCSFFNEAQWKWRNRE